MGANKNRRKSHYPWTKDGGHVRQGHGSALYVEQDTITLLAGGDAGCLAQQSRFSQATHPPLYITELEREAQEAQDKESANEVQQEVAAPKRSFRMAKDDKTVPLLVGASGSAKNGLFYWL